MNITCDMIRDLLPLYAEELASRDSAAAVQEHLQGCSECRRVYEDLKKSPVVVHDGPGLEAVRRGLWKRRFLTALCAVLVVCALGCWGLSWLTAPIYVNESVIAGVEQGEGSTVWITMEAGRAGEYTFQYEVEAAPDGTLITAWTSHWLRWKWNEPVTRKVTVPISAAGNGIYYFTGRPGENDIPIWLNSQQFSGGVMSLPRLYLSFYFLMSLFTGVAALILAFLLRGRRAGKWLALTGSFLCCYGLCQGIVCGFTFTSFFAQQELFWGLSMGSCLWGAGVCVWNMRKR